MHKNIFLRHPKFFLTNKLASGRLIIAGTKTIVFEQSNILVPVLNRLGSFYQNISLDAIRYKIRHELIIICLFTMSYS